MASSEEIRLPTSRGAQTFQALNDSSFRRLWAASWCYYVARMMEMATLLWLVLDLTDSPGKVALVGAFRTAPMFLLGLAAGTLADRIPKRRLLLSAQTLTASVAAALAILLLTGGVPFWYAYIAIFISGIAWTTDFSSRRSLLSEWYSGRRLVNAVSLDSAVLTGSNMMGPLLAGLLIFWLGFAGAYVVVAALYALGVLFIYFLPKRTPQAVQNAEAPISQFQALKQLRANRTIWAALIVTVALNLFGFPFQQMVPVIARDVLGTGSVLYGLLASGYGVGAIMGSLLIAGGRFRSHGTLYSLGATLLVTAVFAFSFSEIYWLSLLLLFAAGFGMSAFSILQPVIVLEAAPPGMRGRAMGAIALAIGFNPLGLIVLGQLAESLDPQKSLAILTGTGILVLLAVRHRYPSLRD